MSPRVTRVAGLVTSVVYAMFIGWLYVRQPQTFGQVTGGVASTLGAYAIDRVSFDDGLRFFRNDQFAEARAAFQRADSAQRDARTQFYIAYSYYRQGWGRVYVDRRLFQSGLDVANRAVALAPGGRLVVDDSNLGMKSIDELKAELERGLTRDLSDLNPLKVFRPRK
jgi:hypothetical protein